MNTNDEELKIIKMLCKVPLFEKILMNDKIMYILAGGATTFVNLFVFWILTNVFGEKNTTIIVCNVISIAISIVFAFFANKIFVFKSKSPDIKSVIVEFVKFFSARLTTMVIEVGGVSLLFSVLGLMSKMMAKFVTQFIVLVINYFISKFFVFKK